MTNWNEIGRCPIWKVLGVTECNNCQGNEQCWGEDAICAIECDFCPQKCSYRSDTNIIEKQDSTMLEDREDENE